MANLQERELPATSFAVLGLLTFGEMSGYDLAKLVERSVGHFFSPAKSQIYAELRRLVDEGYARERAVVQEKRPDKRLFRITPAGEAALRTWLAASPAQPDEIRSQFLLKVFFGHLTDRETVLAHLKQRREDLRARLDELLETERRIAGQPAFRYPYLALRAGLRHTRAGIRWVDESIRDLENEEDER